MLRDIDNISQVARETGPEVGRQRSHFRKSCNSRTAFMVRLDTQPQPLRCYGPPCPLSLSQKSPVPSLVSSFSMLVTLLQTSFSTENVPLCPNLLLPQPLPGTSLICVRHSTLPASILVIACAFVPHLQPSLALLGWRSLEPFFIFQFPTPAPLPCLVCTRQRPALHYAPPSSASFSWSYTLGQAWSLINSCHLCLYCF